ncbi:MAG: terpene cyclase/mutase family protein [Lachnospiraceae bacterium]|nr:terpene cyclase/mutase family protein [Lachnospiraceae bacterium]
MKKNLIVKISGIVLAGVLSISSISDLNVFAANAYDVSTEENSAYSVEEINTHIRNAIDATKERYGLGSEESLLGSEAFCEAASSTGTDWMAIAISRWGYILDGEYKLYASEEAAGRYAYVNAIISYAEETYEGNGGRYLHSKKATENQRATLALTACGGNANKCGTYEGTDIDLVGDGTYNCANPGWQGINGWVYGLLALDTMRFEIPEDALYDHDREEFIANILMLQVAESGEDGYAYKGWSLSGASDPDLTAMTIQSLAPYYGDTTVYTYTNKKSGEEVSKTVKDAIEEGLDTLSGMQRDDGDFASWGTVNVESTAQVLCALTALGIDPTTDQRFITEAGNNLIDGILKYEVDGGGFCHVISNGTKTFNSMANDQAAYALVSYVRLKNGLRSLYDMRAEDIPQENPEEPTETPTETPSDSTDNNVNAYEIELSAGNTVVTENIFEQILEKNKTQDIVIKSGNNVTFYFLKETMSKVKGKNEYDFGVNIIYDYEKMPQEVIKKFEKNNVSFYINYNYFGVLPARAEIKIFTGTEYTGVRLYYYLCKEDGTFEFVQSAVVDEYGYVTISQEHCSDYIAFTKELNMKDNELYVKDELDDKETDKNSTSLDKAPDTGDTSVTYVYLLIELGAMISIAALNLKKRKER